MPELKHGKNLFGEEQDLVAKVKGVLKKKRRPGHTTTCSFRVTEELRDNLVLVAKKHDSYQSDLVREDIDSRAKELLVMPRITGEHPWIDSVLQRKQHKLVITCFRLPFSTQANLRAAAAKHDVDQIRIVRPVLREYAKVALSLPRDKSGA